MPTRCFIQLCHSFIQLQTTMPPQDIAWGYFARTDRFESPPSPSSLVTVESPLQDIELLPFTMMRLNPYPDIIVRSIASLNLGDIGLCSAAADRDQTSPLLYAAVPIINRTLLHPDHTYYRTMSLHCIAISPLALPKLCTMQLWDASPSCSIAMGRNALAPQ